MPNWNDVLQEISNAQLAGQQSLDVTRRKYLKLLQKHTKRSVIAYYSGWQSRPQNTPNLGIGDEDKNGFMTVIHKLDRTSGLDLILHTPGGDIAATESLVDYLWTMFNKDVRVIVPQIAMSAGTMIACAGRSVVMGKQSNLGPIDPQLGGVAAQAVIEEFQMAVEAIQVNPASAPLWQQIVGKYHPTFLIECMQAIDLSKSIVERWLTENMFAASADPASQAKSVVDKLADHALTKTHSRHITLDECETMGLNIVRLEDDAKLQDLVLTVHHAFMHTFSQTPAIKIVENHLGIANVLMGVLPQQMQQLVLRQKQPEANLEVMASHMTE
jgi:Serine dehydrogenase proteinase